ncbi:MAG: mechanosensitive ion channel family protein [Aeromicrobium sp.]|uniref:mechanosensitive ion channel family protein n=1 Tax=Aeromicrobium sp. TaxID=1871063 RepID=UPI0039E57F26
MPDLDLSLPEGKLYEYLVERPSGVLLIVAVAFGARWLIKRFLARIVRRAAEGSVPSVLANSKAGEILADLRPGASERRKQRAKAMGDLLASIATLAIVAIAVVMILDQLGVNIAPLLTGAGILGVALGFGAQTLVKDFLAGVFMILEDQYGVGDSVDLGEAGGTVEAVGLRVTRLRDVNGTVWYVRNGEVLRVGNQSQNWARTVLDVTVGYEADLDQVQAILAEEAEALWRSERYQGVIIEEPEVWGVERFAKDGAVVRVVLKTAPLEQWAVARTMRQRIKVRFDEAGIRIPTSFQTTVQEQQ